MQNLSFTLITDGSSDKTLLNIIKWLLNDLYPELPTKGTFADYRALPKPPKMGDVLERIKVAEEYYPFDILFYHRDAESILEETFDLRKKEIFDVLDEYRLSKTVCVIPVVMMESWLIFDEDAIKKAAGNRNYKGRIDLPALNKIEKYKNPKAFLHELLKQVSGLKGRNLAKFNVHSAVHLVSENITNFNSLRSLSSFRKFEEDLRTAIDLLEK